MSEVAQIENAVTEPKSTEAESPSQAGLKPSVAGLQENQIPVKLVQKSEAALPSGASSSLMYGLGAVILICGVILWFLKKYSVRNKSLAKNNIKILTQHHLGPKKSLAIIQVAGESVLVGITDHHIGLIKTLSLLDDELPELDRQNFNEVVTEANVNAELSDEVKFNFKDDFKMTSLKPLKHEESARRIK